MKPQRRNCNIPGSDRSVTDLDKIDEVKEIYAVARSEYESSRRGAVTVWLPPKAYDGVGKTPESKARSSVWLKLVRFLEKEELEPTDYIRSQFGTMLLGRVPTPEQLMTPRMLDLYRTERLHHGPILQIALQTEVEIATNLITSAQRLGGLSEEEATLDAALDEMAGLSPLFRYCLARSLPARAGQAAVQVLEADAINQFRLERMHYLEHWRSVLPEDMQERSAAMAAAAAGYSEDES